MTMPSDDHMSRANTTSTRRIEVFTGAGRRRSSTTDEKASIVSESYGSDSVSVVARRYGLTPTQLFTWRRTLRSGIEVAPETEPTFVRAVIESAAHNDPDPRADKAEPLIGFDLEGSSVWICPGADVRMVTAIIQALKAAK